MPFGINDVERVDLSRLVQDVVDDAVNSCSSASLPYYVCMGKEEESFPLTRTELFVLL